MPAKSLQELVTYARKNSPFYAELYRDVPERISRITQLPIVDQIEFWAANTWRNNRLLTGPVTDGAVYKTGGTIGAAHLGAGHAVRAVLDVFDGSGDREVERGPAAVGVEFGVAFKELRPAAAAVV